MVVGGRRTRIFEGLESEAAARRFPAGFSVNLFAERADR
jgi:hypothetical protein